MLHEQFLIWKNLLMTQFEIIIWQGTGVTSVSQIGLALWRVRCRWQSWHSHLLLPILYVSSLGDFLVCQTSCRVLVTRVNGSPGTVSTVNVLWFFAVPAELPVGGAPL